MIRVLLADDHPLVRRGLVESLSGETDIQVSGEAGNAAELLTLLRDLTVEVVVLDLSLPDRNGIDVLQQIVREYPKIAVLVLSMHPEEQYASRLLRVGAAGYLGKDRGGDDLIRAIRKVAAGGTYVSAEQAERLVDEMRRGHGSSLHAGLSSREFQVLCLIGRGQGLTEIGEALCLSVKTISTYRARILEKTGLANNAEITRYVLENQLA